PAVTAGSGAGGAGYGRPSAPPAYESRTGGSVGSGVIGASGRTTLAVGVGSGTVSVSPGRTGEGAPEGAGDAGARADGFGDVSDDFPGDFSDDLSGEADGVGLPGVACGDGSASAGAGSASTGRAGSSAAGSGREVTSVSAGSGSASTCGGGSSAGAGTTVRGVPSLTTTSSPASRNARYRPSSRGDRRGTSRSPRHSRVRPVAVSATVIRPAAAAGSHDCRPYASVDPSPLTASEVTITPGGGPYGRACGAVTRPPSPTVNRYSRGLQSRASVAA